jgi:uncharacterized damage-inducible protein DinB
MTEIKKLADELRRSFHGQAWHGPAVIELLSETSAKQAAARPTAGVHTIWEIALHIRAWENAARNWLAGEIMELPVLEGERDWPTVGDTSPAKWEQTVEDLVAVHDEMIRQVLRLREVQLAEMVSGRDYTNYFLLHGLAQHNAYHAGQIALLKKLSA